MAEAMTPEQKIEMYREQIRERPENVLARFSLGQVLMKAERFEEAAAVWEALLRLKPDYLMAWLLYGRTLLRLGRRGEARRALEQHALPLAHRQGHAGPIEEIEGMLKEITDALA